jgi:hypothetical protein
VTKDELKALTDEQLTRTFLDVLGQRHAFTVTAQDVQDVLRLARFIAARWAEGEAWQAMAKAFGKTA